MSEQRPELNVRRLRQAGLTEEEVEERLRAFEALPPAVQAAAETAIASMPVASLPDYVATWPESPLEAPESPAADEAPPTEPERPAEPQKAAQGAGTATFGKG